jgi:Tfp pilus assembly protein FimT
MIEPNGREPRPSRESSLVWLLVVAATAAVLLSIAFPLVQGIKASAEIIEPHATGG